MIRPLRGALPPGAPVAASASTAPRPDSPTGSVAVGGGTAAASAPPAAARVDPDEVTRTLASLADLRDRGAITAEEYEAKKADLLSRL